MGKKKIMSWFLAEFGAINPANWMENAAEIIYDQILQTVSCVPLIPQWSWGHMDGLFKKLTIIYFHVY